MADDSSDAVFFLPAGPLKGPDAIKRAGCAFAVKDAGGV
jgi:hypothetical protein